MERKLQKFLSEDQTKLLKLWISKCEAGRLPLRKQVGPADLIFCLSCVSILESQTSGEFTFRLTASNLKDVLGEECRGRVVSQECGDEMPWSEALKRCQATKAPVFGSTPTGHKRLHHWMRLPLEPMADGRQQILCYDTIRFDSSGDSEGRETMFVTADLVNPRTRSHLNAA